MRLLITAATMLLCVLPSTGNQQQSQPQEKQGGTTVTSNPGGGVTVIVNQAPAAPQTQSTQAKTHNWYEWFWPPVWSNWAIVLVAAIAAKAAFASLDEIKKQAISTEKAAKAASDNAEAVMRGERAWLLIDGIDADPDFAQRTFPRFTYRVSNYGRSPGFMLSANAYVQLEREIDITEDLAFMGMGGIAQDAVVIPKGEPMVLSGNDISAREREFSLGDRERAELFDNGPSAYLWAVGSIHYHDVFGKVRHTPFAYWYDVEKKRFWPVNFPGLNKPA